MQLGNHNNTKHKNNTDFINMKLTTKTFRKILEKQKSKTDKISTTKTDHFFKMINKAFFKQDIKEKDEDYIYRQIKYMQKYHQNLIDLYGKNAQNRIIDFDSEPIKYDKKLLFNPYKKENDKNNIKKYKDDISFKEGPKTILPFIFRKKNKTRLAKNIFLNKNNLTEKNNFSRYNSLNTESSSKYQKQYFTSKNNGNNNSKISHSSEANVFNKNNYLNTLDNLYNETIYKQKKQKRYFKSFDYGCSFYINKCKYITKNLYNN